MKRPFRRAVAPAPDVALQARNVAFDWTDAPLHWMPSEPIASHVVNSLNLLLPEGERMFCAAYRDALPYVRDAKVREAMLGFIGQESMHAETHAKVLDQVLAAHHIDTAPYTRQMEYVFRNSLGARELGPRETQTRLVERLTFIASLEHFFAWLGDWILNADLEKHAAEPRVLDLFRWHGAEEVEHRSVAHDVAAYFGAGYVRRAGMMLMVIPILVSLILRGTKFLVNQDPALPTMGYPTLIRKILGAMWRGALPGIPALLVSALSTFNPRYDPATVGSTEQAIAYLAKSPAARAAGQ
ncbi:metal-dependent hydrolase [Nocardia mangyaensis]|uniref:metal-dependent hydrolase n=1 Tax=Nocardia mangyaensis TaxID=2213200 RepID=UPI00267528FB|nr:metal-dependent hydrolase [Nocardia mangyaensis]MDO3649873.1 metal-dependent hydrolase [Nocardia mangyaensis]